MTQACCPAPDLAWVPRQINQVEWADTYLCQSCGHVHREERYPLPLGFPYNNRCVNCGGGQQPGPDDLYCTVCRLPHNQVHQQHQQYAKIHPTGDFYQAAKALAAGNRFVLATKLATAAIRFGADPTPGMLVRSSCLEGMEMYDAALDELYEWAEMQGPAVVWGRIATIEALTGNLGGALTALENGLKLEPDNSTWWIDHADLMIHIDDRPGATRSAAKALHFSDTKNRAIEVLVEVGERYYAEGQFAQALGVCSLAGDDQKKSVELAWLRARIAATQNDSRYLIEWLEATVALDPDHADASAMLEKYKPKAGWFW